MALRIYAPSWKDSVVSSEKMWPNDKSKQTWVVRQDTWFSWHTTVHPISLQEIKSFRESSTGHPLRMSCFIILVQYNLTTYRLQSGLVALPVVGGLSRHSIDKKSLILGHISYICGYSNDVRMTIFALQLGLMWSFVAVVCQVSKRIRGRKDSGMILFHVHRSQGLWVWGYSDYPPKGISIYRDHQLATFHTCWHHNLYFWSLTSHLTIPRSWKTYWKC